MLKYSSKEFLLRSSLSIVLLGGLPFIVGINPFRDMVVATMYLFSMFLFILVTVLVYRKLKILEK